MWNTIADADQLCEEWKAPSSTHAYSYQCQHGYSKVGYYISYMSYRTFDQCILKDVLLNVILLSIAGRGQRKSFKVLKFSKQRTTLITSTWLLNQFICSTSYAKHYLHPHVTGVCTQLLSSVSWDPTIYIATQKPLFKVKHTFRRNFKIYSV